MGAARMDLVSPPSRLGKGFARMAGCVKRWNMGEGLHLTATSLSQRLVCIVLHFASKWGWTRVGVGIPGYIDFVENM